MATLKRATVIAMVAIIAMAAVEAVISVNKAGTDRILVNMCRVEDKDNFGNFLKLLSKYGEVQKVYTIDLNRGQRNVFDVIDDVKNPFNGAVLLCPDVGVMKGGTLMKIETLAKTKTLILAPQLSQHGSGQLDTALWKFLDSLEIEIQDRSAKLYVQDEFSNRGTPQRVLVKGSEGLSRIVFRDQIEKSDHELLIEYEGRGHRLKSRLNRQIFPLLFGNSSTYVKSSIYDVQGYTTGGIAGRDIALVSGLQSTGGSRSIISLSNKLFTDMPMSRYDNAKFTQSLLDWGFNKRNFLKASDIVANLDGSPISQQDYEPSSTINVSVDITTLKDGSWVPFEADDVQIELRAVKRMSIVTMERVSNATYRAKITLPKNHGTYTLRLKYQRIGLTPLDKSVKVFVMKRVDLMDPPWALSSFLYYLIFSANCLSVPIFAILGIDRSRSETVKTRDEEDLKED